MLLVNAAASNQGRLFLIHMYLDVLFPLRSIRYLSNVLISSLLPPPAVPQHDPMLLHLHHGGSCPGALQGGLAPGGVPPHGQRGESMEKVQQI